MRRQLQAIVTTRTDTCSGRMGRYARLCVTRWWRRLLVSTWFRYSDIAPPPVTTVLRITDTCNLRCRQCGQWGDRGVFTVLAPGSVRHDLSTEEWRQIVSRVSK